MAAVALVGSFVTWLNQRQQSKASKDVEKERIAGAKAVADIAADAAVETALVANFANSLNALEEGHRKLRAEVEAEQEKRAALTLKVQELELELARKQGTIEQLQRDLAVKRMESEQEITALHDENMYLKNQVRLLQEECSSVKAECAALRIQVAEMQQASAGQEPAR